MYRNDLYRFCVFLALYFELSVSDNVTWVEFVFFADADLPASATIYPGIDVAKGKYRIDFSGSEAG